MDDQKLLSLTRIRLPKHHKKLLSSSIDNSQITVFSGGNDVLRAQHPADDDVPITSSLIPSKGIPKHIFDHRKPHLPRKKRAKRLKPSKEIQSIRSQYMYGEEILSMGPSKLSQYSLSKSLDGRNRLQQDTFASLPKTNPKRAADRLRAVEGAIQGEHDYLMTGEKLERLRAINVAEQYINRMPLHYLYSKVELRHYAVERACNSLFKLAHKKANRLMELSMKRWKSVEPEPLFDLSKLNEKQIGFLSIAKRLDKMLKKQLKKYFRIWSFNYGTRFAAIRNKQYNNAAYLIQDWYSKMKVIRKQPFRDFISVIQMCLHRRRAIYYAIKFEQTRRQALNKMRKGIATRRRYHFAARVIQRIMRWLMAYRETKWRLVRIINARRMQRWRRRMMKRPEKDLMLIRVGLLTCGGHTKVVSKMPDMHRNPDSLLLSIDGCISAIQRWYMACMGKMDLFIRLAARRRALELEAKRNKNAAIIQGCYRARLWRELLRAAVINNRARRIQRGYRAHQYRVWVYRAVQRLKARRARKIQRFLRRHMAMRKLRDRFEARRIKMACDRILYVVLVKRVQRNYRAHVIYMAIKKEEMRQFFAAQRLKSDVVLSSVRRIQLNFRDSRRPQSKLCRHVRLYALNARNRERHCIWKAAYVIQKLAKSYIAAQRLRDLQMRIDAANKIWRLAKAYLLKKYVAYLVAETRKRRNAAASRIQHNYRQFTWLKILYGRFAVMKARIELERLRNRSAATIQAMVRKVSEEYNMPLRIAARGQVRKKRRQRREDRIAALRNASAAIVQKFFRGVVKWSQFCKTARSIRMDIRRNNAARRIQRLIRAFLATSRVNRCVRERMRRNREAEIRLEKQNAANTIGRWWKRSNEMFTLRSLFKLRKKMLDEYKRMEAERLKAEEERLEALDEVKASEENMAATILASWKQGSDTNGRNYYYNYVTGESQWDPPDNWTLKVTDAWIRNINERGQVYYYNQQTGESRWLPPCCVCGKEADRWCTDCCAAYCVEDYTSVHDESKDEDMAAHTWAVADLAKEVLKPGQVYCIECKKRVCTKVCLVCWDNYCDQCFKFVHHVGDLKTHETISFRRAKQGWNAIKPKNKGDRVYYVNGLTGETTYEKPKQLMSPIELEYYENFINHREAAESYVSKIDQLQNEVEALKYERDIRLSNDIMSAKKNDKKDSKKGGTGDVMASVKGTSGVLSLLTGMSQAYRARLMQSDSRKRGHQRSEYIKNLLESKEDG